MMVVFSLPTSTRLAWPRSAELHLLERQADFLGDHLAAGQDRDVLEHRLATITEARRLDGDDLEDPAQRVDDERRERLAFDFLGDDEQRTARLGNLLERRQEVADVADLLVEQQHERVVERRGLLVGVVDEVGREVAAVELHALDHLELGGERLAVLDGDDAFLADLVHRVGDDPADVFVAVRRDRSDLGDFLAGRRRLGLLLELLDERRDGLVDAALEVHRVHPRGDVLHAFADDRLGEHRRRGRAVAGDVAGLGSDFLDHLRAHVLELVLELDLLGDRDAVLGDRRAAEGALEHHVAALRAEGDLDRVGEDVDTLDHARAGVAAE
jgi:hypothetical protein